MLYSIHNSKQVADLDSFNSGDIYLSSLRQFSSFVTIKCIPTFLSLLVSIFDVVLFFSKSVKLRGLNLNILSYIVLLVLFFIRWYSNFQKRLNSFMYFNGFFLFRNTTIFFSVLRFMKQWRMLALPYLTKYC